MGELFDTLNSTLHRVDVPGVLWIVALEPLAGRMLTTGKTLGMQHNEEGYGKLFNYQPACANLTYRDSHSSLTNLVGSSFCWSCKQIDKGVYKLC